jgi:hypothetical protein
MPGASTDEDEVERISGLISPEVDAEPEHGS